MLVSPWAKSLFAFTCWKLRLESYRVCSASIDDCGTDIAPLRAAGSPGSQCATVTHFLPVFASCRKRSSLSMEGTIAGFDRMEHSWLDIVSRVIGLHRHRGRTELCPFDRY